ncbi:MAG: hypothetical protein JWM85_937, partial [Acidimicrobiaceae bacterium]|nr:hypothetical protein [Acidimicrobiaceae bacterium]
MQTLPRTGLTGPGAGDSPGRGLGRHSAGRSGGPGGGHGGISGERLRRWAASGAASTFVVVAGVTAFVIGQLRPDLLFNQNMDVGGDNAAHVVAVYYFIHHLLPHGQLSGWDPQWFGGFPLYVFYFPFPAVITAALSGFFSFAVAFKLVSVLGTVLMPIAAWAFGSLAGFRRPVPALMAVAMLPFLFNSSYTIDGGNITSTMAGEFSFSLSVAIGLVFLGVYARSLRTGRLRWLAAFLFALTLLSHVVPALFCAGVAILLTAAASDRRSGALRFAARMQAKPPMRGLGAARRWVRNRLPQPLHVLASVGLTGALLAAFWLLPFAGSLHYSASMGYGRVTGFQPNFLPNSAEVTIQALAVIGLLIGLVNRDRLAIVLGVVAAADLLAFFYLPSGLVYNARWLPFWFLATALLAAYAVGEFGRAVLGARGRRLDWGAIVTPLVGGLATVAVVALFVGVLPGFHLPVSSQNETPGWIAFNYEGYQAKPGWNQFTQLTSMMERVAKVHGCGRLDYEYSSNTTNYYGSTLWPMS